MKGSDRIQNLADALSLKYIKSVIPKIPFILVLCSFNFYFKITWRIQQNYPSPQQHNPQTKINISDSPAKIFLKFLTSHSLSNNNGLYRKKFVQGKWAILGPKAAHPRNSGSIVRVFFKFCRMKGANRYMIILLAVFREKNSFGAIWPF